ncbi:MAG: hypothetical protein P4L71_15700 [Acetobacteraceae bacterium]|nr:hypothetical protein [Acetobacteraceae bacterium]
MSAYSIIEHGRRPWDSSPAARRCSGTRPASAGRAIFLLMLPVCLTTMLAA